MPEKYKNRFPWLVLLLSIAFQLGVLFYLFDSSTFFYKYWELALRLRGVISPPVEVFYSSPLYICFLAFLQGLGLNYLNIQIVQVLLGALNCWLIYRAGRLFFNRPVGIIASLAAVFYGPFLIYNSSFLPAVWVITFNLAALIFLGYAVQRNSTVHLIAAGFFIGLSIITRPNFTIFLFLLIPCLLPNCGIPTFLMSGDQGEANCGRGFQPRSGRGQVIGGCLSGFRRKNPSHKVDQTGLDSEGGGPPTFRWAVGEKWRARVRRIFLLLLPAALVVLPVAGFNYLRSGEFIPVTASGGWVFYCSNNEQVKGFDFSPPPELNDRISAYYARPDSEKLSYLEHLLSREIAQERAGDSLSHRGGSSFWFKEGVTFIREHTGSYLKLLGKKILSAINGYEPHDVPEVMARATSLKPYPLIGFAGLLPFALLGLIIARPRTGGMILYLYLTSYLISFLLMYVIPRFRLAVVPVLLLFAAAAVKRLYDNIRGKQWPALTRNVILLILLAILVNIGTPDIKRDREIVRPAFLHEWKGLTYMKRGEWEKAGEEFAKALELNPGSYQARRGLELMESRD